MKTFEKLTKGHVEAPTNDNGGPADWLIRFKRKVESGEKPSVIAKEFAMMGVATPLTCKCTVSHPEEGAFHESHTKFNRAVHEIISSQPGLIGKLRRVFRNDIRKTMAKKSEDGAIVRKELVVSWLSNFLHSKPTPQWVGITE